MSIATKTGDQGTTGLMYNRRVSKTSPRVEAYGSVAELNTALGLVRATSTSDFVGGHVLTLQKDLVVLMGELATLEEDLPRYVSAGFSILTPEYTQKLDGLVAEIESQNVSFKGWATPGASLNSAALDLARTACRRAERRVAFLQESGTINNQQILVYLNRLSDALWLLARWVETALNKGTSPIT